jgi:predicted RNA-binding protein
MSERFLWKFHWDCGRQGDVEGLFIATEQEIKDSIGESVYFGEILGKHSEVYGEIEEGEIKKIDLDSETVEKVAKILGTTWSGYNPLSYVKYECSVCEDSYTIDTIQFIDEKWICDYCKEENE